MSKLLPLYGVVATAAAVVVVAIAGFVWIADKFDAVRNDIAGTKQEVTRIGTKVEDLDRRVGRLEDRFDAKFGADDGGVVDPPDASVTNAVWNQDHVKRREKFCGKMCGTDNTCAERCAADYNACGIRCPSDLNSSCFRECVIAIK